MVTGCDPVVVCVLVAGGCGLCGGGGAIAAAFGAGEKVTDEGDHGTWHYLLVSQSAIETASTFAGRWRLIFGVTATRA